LAIELILDRTSVEDDTSVSDLCDLLHIGARHNNRFTSGRKIAKKPVHLSSGSDVDSERRIAQDEHSRPGRDCPTQQRLLLIASAEGTDRGRRARSLDL
jgi:hypothetical protein